MGLILLVLSSSFTVTVCTVRDYHRVEFQAILLANMSTFGGQFYRSVCSLSTGVIPNDKNLLKTIIV